MNNAQNLDIRALRDNDPPVIAVAFVRMGWNKPEEQYRQYRMSSRLVREPAWLPLLMDSLQDT